MNGSAHRRRSPRPSTGAGRERRVVRRLQDRGEVLEHQHDLGGELEADRQIPMPFVRRAFGAQAIGDLGVEKARNRAEEREPRQREIAARVEAGLARPSGVPLLGRRLRIVGARGCTRPPRPRTPIRPSTRASASGPVPNSYIQRTFDQALIPRTRRSGPLGPIAHPD